MLKGFKRREKEFYDKMKEMYNDSLDFSESKYLGSKKPIKVRCMEHGEYITKPCYLVRGSKGCLACSGKFTKDDFIKLAKEQHGDRYLYDKVVFSNTDTPIIVTCREHGDFKVKPYNHYKLGTNCPTCATSEAIMDKGKFLEKAKLVHGNKYCYQNLDFRGYTETVKIGCFKHGTFHQKARVHLNGSGCPACYRESTKKTLEDFIAEAQQVHGHIYNYDRVEYVNNKTPITVVCKGHGPFKTNPNRHVSQKQGCPRCRESLGERQIAHILEVNGIEFKREYKFDGSLFRYDFFLPKFEVLIEFHGIQHYEPVERFGGYEALEETKMRDWDKVKLANSKQIPLVVLNYLDLDRRRLRKMLSLELAKLNISII
tara:strand:+ start:14173 stop:15285 length:1113 start_codon:yes stop_codon:yes gene_type:complete